MEVLNPMAKKLKKAKKITPKKSLRSTEWTYRG